MHVVMYTDVQLQLSKYVHTHSYVLVFTNLLRLLYSLFLLLLPTKAELVIYKLLCK